MRTYTRKRPEHKEVENVLSLCRLCLGHAEDSVPIFDDSGSNSGSLCGLALRIMMCVGLEMTNEDCLPNKVCEVCYKELERYYAFRKKCEASYQKLKSHVLAVREKEYILKVAQEKELTAESGNIFVFTMNGDGTISMTEKIPSDVEQLITDTKLEDNIDSKTFLDSKVPSRIELSESESSQPDPSKSPASDSDKELVIHINGTDAHILKMSSLTEDPSTNSLNPSEEETEPMEFATFLSTKLLELGMLNQQDSFMEFGDHNMRIVEVETGDGQVLTLELAEEEEKVHCIQPVMLTSEKDIKQLKNCKTHIKDKGSDRGPVCPICHKQFATASVAARHARAVHARLRPWRCPRCAKCFAQKAVMLRHEKVHDDERPFKCPSCAKSFTQRSALAQHSRSHQPPNARTLLLHPCAHCPKVFLYASGLSRHLSSHTGKRYFCTLCPKQFSDPSSLQRHLTNHLHSSPPVQPITNENDDAAYHSAG